MRNLIGIILSITLASPLAWAGPSLNPDHRASSEKSKSSEAAATVIPNNKTPAVSANIKKLITKVEKSAGRSKKLCYRYVKNALLQCGMVDKYLGQKSAKNAGPELLAQGFRKIKVSDPYKAPPGAVLVYSGGPHGHIEIRTFKGFASDYFSTTARTGASTSGVGRGRKLIGVYYKT